MRNTAPQTGPTALFLKGLYAGLRDVGVPAVGVELTSGDGTAIKAFERSYLVALLERHKGSGSAAVAEAGIARSYFYRLLDEHGIKGRR